MDDSPKAKPDRAVKPGRAVKPVRRSAAATPFEAVWPYLLVGFGVCVVIDYWAFLWPVLWAAALIHAAISGWRHGY